MDTLSVNICYRPLRIGWAIRSDDMDSFRKAVKYSNALWGGRYNPIIFVDHEEEARRLIELFRVDLIMPIGDSAEVREFSSGYPHLEAPFHDDQVFRKGEGSSPPMSHVLDVHNAMVYIRDLPEWVEKQKIGLRSYTWDASDPLADVFSMQLGEYPDSEDVGLDYSEIFKVASSCTEVVLDKCKPIPGLVIDRSSIPYVSSFGIKEHYSIRSNHQAPGFFVGSANSLQDLATFWNLQACDISLWFVDPDHISRYSELIQAAEIIMQRRLSAYLHKMDRMISIWSKPDDYNKVSDLLNTTDILHQPVSSIMWNGLNVNVPMMYFDEQSALGVQGTWNNKPKVSFALPNIPVCDGSYFHTQHLVASVNVATGLYGDEMHTIDAPYIPELNDFYCRSMQGSVYGLRSEPERMGIVISATSNDTSLHALPVAEFMEEIFKMAGYAAKLSNAGLITQQLISRLGGVQGGRLFKIPGVRRLLSSHSLTKSLTMSNALSYISGQYPGRSEVKFKDHENLYIEERPIGEKLKPDAVFGYMVEKGLFRMGADVNCPLCKITSWVALDLLKHNVTCDLCGHKHDVTRQLTVSNKWDYRRSGVFGIEKNAHGAVPVVLTLQHLDSNFNTVLSRGLYIPSVDLHPIDNKSINDCETDFVWFQPARYPDKSIVVLSECKDKGPINAKDVENLKRVADSFPKNRFKTYVVLSQISPFTPDQIANAKTLNAGGELRAILLSANELEPCRFGPQARSKATDKLSWRNPNDMAESTSKLYFSDEKAS